MIFMICVLPLSAETKLVTYKNDSFNYEIQVPESWQTVDLNMKDKHIMYAFTEKNTEIKVKASRSVEEDIDKIISNNKWNLRNIDARLNSIIETGKISIKQNVIGKLLVFEYHTRKNTILQRTLVTLNGGIVYIVECKSPIKNFYNYDQIFNSALSSFNFINPAAAGKETTE